MYFLLLSALTLLIIFVYFSRQNASASEVSAERGEEAIEATDLRDVEEAITEMAVEPYQFAIVFLDSAAGLSIERTQKFISKKWGLRFSKGAIESVGMRRKFSDGSTKFSYELLNPMGDNKAFEHACMHNSEWPNAAKELENHKYAVLVGVSTQGPAVPHAIALSQAVAALMSSCKHAMGVLWSTAYHVLPRKTALKHFGSSFKKELPLHLWVACKAYQDEAGRTIGYTQGLRTFGSDEYEAIDAPESPDELHARLTGIVCYAIGSCNQVFNGDTIGQDAMERIKVKKAPSETVHNGWVFQLSYLKQSPAERWK